MGFSWFSRKKKSAPTGKKEYGDSFFDRFLTRKTYAGENVNYSSAMRHNDVYTCVRIKAESLGQLPVKLYRTDEGKRVEILSGREFEIFTQKPNPFQTWQDFNEQFVTAIELLGKFGAEIKRNRFGNVYSIVPFKEQAGIESNIDSEGNVYYTYTTNDNRGRVTVQKYKSSEVMFIKAFTLDGYTGISTISQCALAIGTAIAGEKHSAALFENGAMPMGVLQTDESMGDDEEAIQRLRQQWQELHSGAKNSGKTAILEYGLKYNPITMTAVDSQLLEQRKFSREQIASMFRVPLHLLQASTGMKYSNVEQNNIAFFRDALMPLAQKLENNINQLLPKNHSIKLDEKVFIRGDRKTLVSTVKEEITAGLCSINEGRADLGRDPVEGGDVFAVQTNNLTFGSWKDLPKMREQERQDALTNSAGNTSPSETEQTEEEPSDDDQD